MQYPHDTLIAVTDGRSLRVFRNVGDDRRLQLVELPAPDVRANGHAAVRAHHRSGADESHGHSQENSHAAAAAAWLNAQVVTAHVPHVYVVAPSRTLGELRRHYHPKLKERLLGELHKEHTHDAVDHLQDALLRA